MTAHQLTLRADGRYECAVCRLTWKWKPTSDCPGVPVYDWGKWSEYLLTKKQMSDAGYQTGRKLPAPAGACYRKDSPGGIMWLYDRAQGVPKAPMTPARAAALEKAKAASQHGWHCADCGTRLGRYHKGGGRCPQCVIVHRVRKLLEGAFVILDSETTGLDDAEFVQVAVIDHTGSVLVDTLIQPRHPERLLECGDNGLCASDINGIHPEMLTDAPTFEQVYPQLFAALNGKICVVYNVGFDIPVLEAACAAAGLPVPECTYKDAMVWYAQWYGDWSSYWRDYRWQRLPGGDHTAAGDCRAVLALLHYMAQQAEPEQVTEVQRSE